MKLNAKEIKKLVELCDIPFEESFLEIDSYRNKKDKLILKFGRNFCPEANKAFELGLLKDFVIKGIQSKSDFRMIKIAEYAKENSYDRDESHAGSMDIIIVYKAFCDFGDVFIAVKTCLIFPMLHRDVVDFKNKFNEILLPPYISEVYVWASESFNELMNRYPYEEDIMYRNTQIDTELYEGALFMLQLYDLDNESKRCLMHIDTGLTSRYTINIDDLKNRNYEAMYCIRPRLNK